MGVRGGYLPDEDTPLRDCLRQCLAMVVQYVQHRASASYLSYTYRRAPLIDFVISKVTPTLQANLGYNMYFLFGAINLVLMTTFSLYVPSPLYGVPPRRRRLIAHRTS